MQGIAVGLPDPGGSGSEAEMTPDRQYRIDLSEMGLLGSGAHGVVRIAQHVETGDYVAVKIMPTTVIRTACKEVMALSRLNNPHIVQLLSVQVDMHLERVYVLMELCQGGELFDRIAECGGLDEAEAKRYFAQILAAMHHCHQNNVFHRDLKPENILLDAEDNAKVADFGLAAVCQHVADDATFLRHTKVGSVMYAAPEVLTSTAGVGYDAAHADMWSLGIILYSMLSGTLPFQCAAASRCKRYAAVMRQGIQVMCPENMSPTVVQLLARMLDPNPAGRYSPTEALQCEWFRDALPPQIASYSGDGAVMRSWTVTMRVAQRPDQPMLDAAGGQKDGCCASGDVSDCDTSFAQADGDNSFTRKRAREEGTSGSCESRQSQGVPSTRDVCMGAGLGSSSGCLAACATCASSLSNTQLVGARGDQACGDTDLSGSCRSEADFRCCISDDISTAAPSSACGESSLDTGSLPVHELPLRGFLSAFVSEWGWGPLPHGTEQLLRDILQTLHSLGLQYTLREEAETENAGDHSLTDDDTGSIHGQLQRITLKINFSAQLGMGGLGGAHSATSAG